MGFRNSKYNLSISPGSYLVMHNIETCLPESHIWNCHQVRVLLLIPIILGKFHHYPYKLRADTNTVLTMKYQKEIPFPCTYTMKMNTQGKAVVYKSGRQLLPDPELPNSLILDFPYPRSWKINFYCWSHPVNGVLLWQPDLRYCPF